MTKVHFFYVWMIVYFETEKWELSVLKLKKVSFLKINSQYVVIHNKIDFIMSFFVNTLVLNLSTSKLECDQPKNFLVCFEHYDLWRLWELWGIWEFWGIFYLNNISKYMTLPYSIPCRNIPKKKSSITSHKSQQYLMKLLNHVVKMVRWSNYKGVYHVNLEAGDRNKWWM